MGRITINPYEKGPRKSLKKDIKTQDKEIEITSNGTTEVIPDEGFTYLNSVSVKTNVEGQGGTIIDDMLYVNVLADPGRHDDDAKDACRNAALIKIIAEGVTCIVPTGAANTFGVIGTDNVLAFAYHANDPVIISGLSEEAGIEEIKTLQDFYKATYGRAKYITKEEFYTIDNVEGNSVIEFTINGTSYQAEEGMTWGEWVNSDYNTGNFISNGSDILTEDSTYYVSDSITLGAFVNREIEERQYILEPVDSGSSGGEEEGNGSFS